MLLDLDLNEPADHGDIEAIHEILVRRVAACSAEPTDGGRERPQGRPALHLVPDPTP